MVRHTHQDFLQDVMGTYIPDSPDQELELALIKDASQEKDLFDYGGFYRKMPLSYLDEHIDDLQDWDLMVSSLRGIDCLYLIDDRGVINPIMADYARVVNKQYVLRFASDGIRAVIVVDKGTRRMESANDCSKLPGL